MIIPQTPAEAIFQGTAGVWNILHTADLDIELALRHSILEKLSAPVDPNKSRIDALRPIYKDLTTFLSGEHYRLFLYLPSTLIPNVDDRHDPIIANYIEAILYSFRQSLREITPRADITNGDEPDWFGFISPAAVVARILVQKGLLTEDWATFYNQGIKDSYADMLQVALPAGDPTYPKRDAWLKWEHQRQARLDELDRSNPPNLEGPLSPNLQAAAEEIAKLQQLIITDNELQKLIYPVAVVYGSRLKGYGSSISDLDIAVFVRQNDKFIDDVIPTIQSKIPGAITYWIKRNDNILEIDDFDKPHKGVGTPYDAHILFNGVWVGDEDAKRFLCYKLLKPITESKHSVRAVLRRELERDLLLYRLLHRGYETCYKTTHPTFLDDGYRLLATKLYLRYIFLP